MIGLLFLSNYAGISRPVVSNYYLPMYLLGEYMAIYSLKQIINSGDTKNNCLHRYVVCCN